MPIQPRPVRLNQTYQSIVKEAEQHVSADADAAYPELSNTTPQEALRLHVIPPGYRHVALLGDRFVEALSDEYLSQQSDRLRPGS